MKDLIFRQEKIIELCREKSVLHLGCVQHSDLYERKIKENDWLHQKIDAVSKRCVGVDYLEDDVIKIREKYGYEIYFGNVTDLKSIENEVTNNKYEVIVCGELIEHVDNPGLMLDVIKTLMNKNSILIITTPNPWASLRIKFIKKGVLEEKWLNKEHVGWYSYQTLKQLLERKGYSEVQYDYYVADTAKHFSVSPVKHKLKNLLIKVGFLYNKHFFYDGLFFVAKL